jgi:hypothetical protein
MEITIDQFTQRIQALFFNETALEFVAEGTRDALHEWYAGLPEDWFDNTEPFPDGTSRHSGARSFMAPLSTAWKYALRENGFDVVFDEKRKVEGEPSHNWGLALQQYGDTITPVRKKALTIPVTADARKRTVKMYQQATGNKLFTVKKRDGKDPSYIGSLVWEDPMGTLHAVYVLSKRAEIKPLKERRGHDALPSSASLTEWAVKAYNLYLKHSNLS